MAANLIAQFERTVMADLFVKNWRLVVFAGIVVGYTPFRDCSLVLTIFSAGRVLSQLHNYLSEDKARRAPVPYGEFIPKKGKRTIDYFYTTSSTDLRALLNYALASCLTASDAVVRVAADLQADKKEIVDFLLVYSCLATSDSGERIILWPSVYWSEIRNDGMRVFQISANIEDIIEGRVEDEGTSLASFTRPWTQECLRGVVGQYHTIYDKKD
jgi:hypothetical protein